MKNIFYTLLIALFIVSCGNNDSSPESNSGNSSESNKTAVCLQNYNYQYEKLLTKDDIAKYVTIDEASYKIKISSITGKYGSCSYEWLSDRPDLEIEISGVIIKGPDRNRVVIKQLDFYTDEQLKLYSQESAIALFDQSYKKLSQQEYNDLLENLKKQYADNPTEYERAKGFLDARMNLTYEPVNDLADRAYWKWNDTYGLELVVLSGAAHFTIETKVTAQADTTLDAAVNLAKEVLAKCNN